MLTMNQTKNELINLLNNANLTVEQIYYILKDLFEDVARQYNAMIEEEQRKEKEEKEKKEEEKTDGENQEN